MIRPPTQKTGCYDFIINAYFFCCKENICNIWDKYFSISEYLCADLPSGGLAAFHHKAAVDAVLTYQFIMSALLNDLSAA